MAANLWTFEEMQSFYASYAHEYDSTVTMETYPAPFLIGKWCIEHVETSFQTVSRNNNKINGVNTYNNQNVLSKGQQIWGNSPIRVLDLGCGTGISSVPFFTQQKFRVEIDGVDGSKEMLEKARNHPFRILKCQDIESEIWGSGEYDLMVCIGVMDFVRNPRKLLEKARLVLRKDGRLGLTLPEGGDMNSFHRVQAEQLIKDAGFWVERHEKFTGYTDSSSGEHVYYHGYLLSKII